MIVYQRRVGDTFGPGLAEYCMYATCEPRAGLFTLLVRKGHPNVPVEADRSTHILRDGTLPGAHGAR
jgi:hypothetical protein